MPHEPLNLSLRNFESAIMRNVFNSTVPVTNVLMGAPGPRRMVDKVKHNRTDEHIPLHMDRIEYAKKLKMLSLSPSIYGNIYGVLGNS